MSQVVKDIKNVEEEVSSLKKKLDDLNESKEHWFAKKSEFGNQIKELIGRVKDLKKDRNSLTNEVKDLKKKRDSLNKEIGINPAVKRTVVVNGRKVNVGKIKKEHDDLEFKIQTTPMSFDKEQKMMKRVKELRKQLDSAKKDKAEKDESVKLSKEAKEIKEKANNIHKSLKDKADKSQEIHETLISESKKIDELKEQEESAYKKFFELKKTFTDLNNELKDKLRSIRDIQKKTKTNKKAKEKEQQKELIAEKAKDVEEKISKKKKLTTEDILILQRSEDHKEK